MNVIDTEIPEIKILAPKVWRDERGYFFESFNATTFANLKIAPLALAKSFVQDNEAKSAYGALRGLHYQVAPFAQTKLVRVVRGAVWDVAVDIRLGSPTFGKHVGVELSEENQLQFLVPAGFAHGYVALRPDTVFLYKVDHFYDRDSERGIIFNDVDLAIPWPISQDRVLISEKDRALQTLSSLRDTGFTYLI